MRTVLFIYILTMTLFSAEINLTRQQANYIAKKVWQNEGAGKDKYLVWWNKGEDFASVGIGHFIWFPKGHTERFREVFPMVVAFMQKKGVEMPKWLTPQTDLPWQTKAEFFAAKKQKSKHYMELFSFLKRTMPQQAEFMAERLRQALPQILDTIKDPKKAAMIERRFNHMLYKKNGKIDERGLYILLDYTNFKGEGTLKSERYKGQGWGLLQVLEHLDEKNPNKYKAFADSAKAMLSRRIKNSPPARGEERWRRGWNVRLDTYWK
ncbi:hypothetical protein [Sulfurovum sp. NBC37-1]|uniref:hypothetical protein n=1 Tax=Sulfurovum sp. (strain NBC37-1) TaxID=387093 RepID=UPI0001587519|nr:hypothetical protein [Sulfurovum sp. NBC37-1]BAF71792.1 conserved hypothetical protein [Sulfurovum sp. NBC37-1]